MLHALDSAVKVFLWVSGKSIWLSDVQPCTAGEYKQIHEDKERAASEMECVLFDFDERLVDKFRDTIKYVSMVMCVLSCILDIAIYKKRSLVDLILYMELLHLTFLTTIPSPNNNYTDLYIIMVHYFMFTAFFTNKGGHIIVSLIS